MKSQRKSKVNDNVMSDGMMIQEVPSLALPLEEILFLSVTIIQLGSRELVSGGHVTCVRKICLWVGRTE